MGFAAATPPSMPHVSLRNSHQKDLILGSCMRKETWGFNFYLPKLKYQSRISFCCINQPIDSHERTSPNEDADLRTSSLYHGDRSGGYPKDFVKKEIEQCYELIHRLGRGVVYLGSSRMGPGHPHYTQTFELGNKIATLLDCTTWSGAGPGLMDAATQGALQAGKPVGGFKIGREAGEWTATNFHPYLPAESYHTCRFFSARKHGLVDAVVRCRTSERTAVIALPGGIGTLDEVFEIMALIQLERIGSRLPVPLLLMNYDSFYSNLLEFLNDCEKWGTVSKGEVASLWKICNNNSEALAYLAEFYGLSPIETSRKDSESAECKTLP